MQQPDRSDDDLWTAIRHPLARPVFPNGWN
jgi:hypothetical protein